MYGMAEGDIECSREKCSGEARGKYPRGHVRGDILDKYPMGRCSGGYPRQKIPKMFGGRPGEMRARGGNTLEIFLTMNVSVASNTVIWVIFEKETKVGQ